MALNFLFYFNRLTVFGQTLANVTSSPGSYIDPLIQLDEEIDSTPDNAALSFHATMFNGEGHTTFVPTFSALDINSTDWFSPANAKTHLSPFDVLYANGNLNTHHSTMSGTLFINLVDELDEAEAKHKAKLLIAAVTASF